MSPVKPWSYSLYKPRVAAAVENMVKLGTYVGVCAVPNTESISSAEELEEANHRPF